MIAGGVSMTFRPRCFVLVYLNLTVGRRDERVVRLTCVN